MNTDSKCCIYRLGSTGALQTPGVKATITGRYYTILTGSPLEDRPPIAIDKVRYYGEPQYLINFVETPHLEAPYELRGIGEHGLIGMPAALANSLSNAAGEPPPFRKLWNGFSCCLNGRKIPCITPEARKHHICSNEFDSSECCY